MRQFLPHIFTAAAVFALTGCAAGTHSSAGGELTGVGAASWVEPAPYGMVLIDRGSIVAGPQEKADTVAQPR